MLHVPPGRDEMEEQLQLSQLRYVTTSRAAAITLAENYAGYRCDWATPDLRSAPRGGTSPRHGAHGPRPGRWAVRRPAVRAVPPRYRPLTGHKAWFAGPVTSDSP